MTMADNQDKKVLNVPVLRFPEFNEEWKEKRLDEIAGLSKGVGISKEQLSEEVSQSLCIHLMVDVSESLLRHLVLQRAH